MIILKKILAEVQGLLMATKITVLVLDIVTNSAIKPNADSNMTCFVPHIQYIKPKHVSVSGSCRIK